MTAAYVAAAARGDSTNAPRMPSGKMVTRYSSYAEFAFTYPRLSFICLWMHLPRDVDTHFMNDPSATPKLNEVSLRQVSMSLGIKKSTAGDRPGPMTAAKVWTV
jgi:hypothetical protein